MQADDITVTILTGRRPHLLERTLKALPDELWNANVIVLHNGGDIETATVLSRYPVHLRYTVIDGLWPIGKATSELFRLAQVEKRSFVLYLQDDWECRSDGEWWTQAVQLLDDDPTVGQVRLRLTNEPTNINVTSVTGRRVRWTHHDTYTYRVSDQAPWSLNPALMRTHELPTEITDERDGMIQFSKRKQSVAQLMPGVFAHIGDKGQSLRIRADKERRYGI